jgi:hypothetical protein
MGIEVALLAVAAANFAVQAEAASDQRRKSRESRKISATQQRIDASRQARSNLRQERIRRAQIEQAAVNTGTSGSSGELGSSSAIGTFAGATQAATRQQESFANRISQNNQAVADSRFRAQIAGGITDLFSSGVSAFNQPQVK